MIYANASNSGREEVEHEFTTKAQVEPLDQLIATTMQSAREHGETRRALIDRLNKLQHQALAESKRWHHMAEQVASQIDALTNALPPENQAVSNAEALERYLR